MNEKDFSALIDKFLTRKPLLGGFLAILILTGLAYANSVNHPFVHDDVVFIQQNPAIGKLDILDILTAPSSFGNGTGIINTYWRPFLELIYRLQYKAYGLNPALFHLTNVVLHGLNSFLLYLVLLKFPWRRPALSLAAALIFLLHPLQSESVACISGISNVLLAFFLFGSLLLYFQYRQTRRGGYLILSFAAYFLGLLTKEQAVILPVVLLLYHVTLDERQEARKFIPVTGFIALVGIYFVMRRIITGSMITSSLAFDQEFLLRLLSIPRTLLGYLKSFVFPFDLHYYRNTDILASNALSFILFAAALITLFIYYQRRPGSRRIVFFSLGWFFVSLLPMLNIVPLINEFSFILTADHFLYIPLVGLTLFFLALGDELLSISTAKKQALFIGLCVLYLGLTISMNKTWASETALFERTVRFEKDFGRGHHLLAKAYYFEKQYDASIEHFSRALDIMRDYHQRTTHEQAKRFYAGYLKSIYFDMAHSFEAKSDFARSIELYQQALQLDPQDSVLMNNIGLNYIRSGDQARAEEYFKRALALDQTSVLAKNNLATLYAILGRVEEARLLFEEILAQDPGNEAARNNLGLLRMDTEMK